MAHAGRQTPVYESHFPNVAVAVNILYDHYTAQHREDAFICYARPKLAAYCLERLGDEPQVFRDRYVHFWNFDHCHASARPQEWRAGPHVSRCTGPELRLEFSCIAFFEPLISPNTVDGGGVEQCVGL